MCGFVVLTSPRIRDADRFEVERQSALISHRGPDNEGFWLSDCERVFFAHRRLSVVDLSLDGNQPMQSDCGQYSIVFNGEIYNFRELRSQLESAGFSFSGSSDTKVLLAAYIEWGEDCVSHFNGMFSFIIYDASRGINNAFLFMARDRAGEKPFYYLPTQDGYAFGSELKAIPHKGELDINALNHYLALGYIPSDLCLFAGVKKLPPGYCGKLNLKTNELTLKCYWKLPKNSSEHHDTPFILANEAWDLIKSSVSMRMEADVPVGVLLSGGLDSSLVTAAAAQSSSKPIETYTIALPGSKLDESSYAKTVADYFDTRHTVLPLDSPSLNLLDGLEPFIDEPIADSSILPAWLVFGIARKNVTVALGGDGGDEIFGGYDTYSASISDAKTLKYFPGLLTKGIASLASLLPVGVKGRNKLSSLREGPYRQHIWGTPYFDIESRKKILKSSAYDSIRQSIGMPEKFLLGLYLNGNDPIDSMTRMDFGSILPDDFLVKVDRASMAHSLEVRAPFLDHRLIEFGFSKVPSHWKISGGESRRLQQVLARQELPSTLNTQRKQGFSIPLDEWLRSEGESKLMSRMEDLPDVINQSFVRDLIRGHMKGRKNGGRIFGLIMLTISMRNMK